MDPADLFPSLAELVALIPPPPIGVDGDWGEFSRLNGFEPPTEWMVLMSRYGCGVMGGEAVQLHDPFPEEGTFAACSELDRRQLRGWMREYDFFPDWGVWPDPGGFLPWASLRDGSGDIGWLTIGPSDTWPVAVIDRSGDGVVTGLGTLDYLVRLAQNVDDEAFAQNGIGWMDELTFTPYRIRSGQLPTHEPLSIQFAAEQYEPLDDDGRVRSHEESLAALVEVSRRLEPLNETWDRRWASAAELLERCAAAGIHFERRGFHGTERGRVHPTASVRYPVDAEAEAKAALAALAGALGTTVTSVQNLEGDAVWTDLCDRPA